MITIRYSKQPFRRYEREDWICLIGYCGSIHQVLRDSLSLSEPLIHTSESDWIITQVDIGYDIPYSTIDRSKGFLSFMEFNGSLQIRHLDAIYQVYSMLLADKGRCLGSEDSYTSLPTLLLNLLYLLCIA